MFGNEFEQIREAVQQSADRIENIGYRVEDLSSLVFGTTQYRPIALRNERALQLEKERGDALSAEEVGRIYQEIITDYDPFSPDNLAETLRYQYDRVTKEDKLRRRAFPKIRSTVYQQIHTELTTMGPLLRKLQELRPDANSYEVMPFKSNGVWYENLSAVPLAG